MSTKQTFKIKIGGVDYTSYLTYPVSVTDKRLDESLNLCELTLGRIVNSVPFKPNRQVILETYVDNILEATDSYIILSDVTTKLGFTNMYDHKLTLIEYTYVLSQTILPDFTITRVRVYYEPTLLDAANRVRNLMTELTGLSMFFDQETQDKLSAIQSPEWTFTRQTALEAYRMIFSLAKIVPVAYIVDGYSFDGIRHVEVSPEIAGAIDGFGFKQEAYDPQTYKTALYSNVSNFVTGENDTITEPANGWLSVRSPDGYKIQEDNAYIPTSRPIYKLDDLIFARFLVVGGSFTTGGATVWRYNAIPHSIIPMEWLVDIDSSQFVFEKDLWDTKENIEDIGEKGGSLYYTQAKSGIHNLSYIPPTRWSWLPNAQAWRNIVGSISPFNSASLIGMVKPEYIDQAILLAKDYWELTHSEVSEGFYYGIGYEEDKAYGTSYNSTSIEVYNMQFRVKYTPMVDTNLFTYRERKFEDDDEVQTFQYYNQSATVIDSDVLAELHDKVIKRGSGTSLSLTYVHNEFADILEVGKRIGDYIITSSDIIYGYSGIKVIYNLDKYYAKLQKYVAVLEEYRQYSIPNENIVNRQLTINRFAKISRTMVDLGGEVDVVSYIDNSDSEVNLVKMYQPTSGLSTILTTTNFAFNNSLVFEAKFGTNANAGAQSNYFDSNTRVDKPVIYTDPQGRIEENATITFGTDFTNFSLAASQILPISNDPLVSQFLTVTDWIEKDSREILSLSLQLHHVDTSGKVYINSGLAKYNGVVGGIGLNDLSIQAAFFNIKPHTEKILADANVLAQQSGYFNKSVNSVEIKRPVNTSGAVQPAWGYVKDLGNGTHEVLFWVDESTANGATVNQYYINFDDKY